jgi:predicted transcriptional regulator
VKGAAFAMVALTVAAAMGAAGFAKDKTANQEPIAWGAQSGNTGCVIFRESEETTSEMAAGGGFTTQTVKQLEVLDSIQATLPKKKYGETKEDLDALQALSMQNHLKYVKIPKKYTPEQLEKAKTLCGVN